MKHARIVTLNNRGGTMSEYQYKYNAKKVAYDTQYRADHYDRLDIRLPKGYKDKIKEQAKSRDISVNNYIKNLIDNDI